MKTIITMFGIGVGLVIIIILALVFPILYIWALNTLFPVLAIPYTIETWAAAVLLGIFFSKTIDVKKDKE
jgi:hypothetical protein